MNVLFRPLIFLLVELSCLLVGHLSPGGAGNRQDDFAACGFRLHVHLIKLEKQQEQVCVVEACNKQMCPQTCHHHPFHGSQIGFRPRDGWGSQRPPFSGLTPSPTSVLPATFIMAGTVGTRTRSAGIRKSAGAKGKGKLPVTVLSGFLGSGVRISVGS